MEKKHGYYSTIILVWRSVHAASWSSTATTFLYPYLGPRLSAVHNKDKMLIQCAALRVCTLVLHINSCKQWTILVLIFLIKHTQNYTATKGFKGDSLLRDIKLSKKNTLLTAHLMQNVNFWEPWESLGMSIFCNSYKFYGRIQTFRTCRRRTIDTGASKIGQFHFSIS